VGWKPEGHRACEKRFCSNTSTPLDAVRYLGQWADAQWANWAAGFSGVWLQSLAEATPLTSCRIEPFYFLAGWLKRWPEPGIGFVRCSFASIYFFIVFINCCLGFLCCHLVVIIFVMLVAVKRLGRKTSFLCQSNDWLGRSGPKSPIMCWVDIKPYYTIHSDAFPMQSVGRSY